MSDKSERLGLPVVQEYTAGIDIGALLKSSMNRNEVSGIQPLFYTQIQQRQVSAL